MRRLPIAWRFFLFAGTLLAFSGRTPAQTTWDAGGGTNTSWGAATNWNNDTLPSFDGTESLTVLLAYTDARRNVVLGGNRAVNMLTFGNTVNNAANACSLGSSGDILTLRSTAGTYAAPQLMVTAQDNGSATFNNDILLDAAAGPGSYTAFWRQGTGQGSAGGVFNGRIYQAAGQTWQITFDETGRNQFQLRNANNSVAAMRTDGATVYSSAPGAFGGAALTLNGGSFGVNTGDHFSGSDAVTNSLTLVGASSWASARSARLTGSLTQGANTLTYSGGAVARLEYASVSGSGATVASASSLAPVDMTPFSSGSLTLGSGGGVLVLGSGDVPTWAQFAAARTYNQAGGAGTWRIDGGTDSSQGGGFAARGGALTLTAASAGMTTGTFNRNVVLGSLATVGGALYAAQPVTIAQDTTFTTGGQRALWLAGNGGTKSTTDWVVAGPVHELAGSLTGDAVRLTLMTRQRDGGNVGQLRLSGTNSFTGASSLVIGGKRGNFTTPSGRTFTTDNGWDNGGGVLIGTSDAAFGGVDELLVYCAGSDTGAVGGMLLLEDANAGGGTTFSRAFTVLNSAGSTRGAGFGSYAGDVVFLGAATLTGTFATGDFGVPLAVREGTLTLGGVSAAALTVDHSRPTKLNKGGEGTLELRNLNVGGTQTNIAWAVYRGALRETGSSTNNSVVARNLSLRGGVLEFGAEPRAVTLGTGAGQVNMGAGGGGGFAAHGADRTIGINAGAALTWASTASFLGAGQPLVLGSRTADADITLTNNIALNGATRTVALVDNPAVAGERGRLAGALTGNASSHLLVTGDGVLELAGACTYAGNTTVNTGATLVVNGSLDTQTSSLTVRTNAVLAGSGAIGRAVACEDGATLSPGDGGPGTLTVAALTLAGGCELDFDVGSSCDRIAVQGALALDGTLNVTPSAGFGPGTNTVMTYTGAFTNNGLEVGTAPLGYLYSIDTAVPGEVRLVVAPGSLPIITHAGGVSDLTAYSAVVNGMLVSTGEAATAVFLFWGASDGDTEKADWGHTNSLGFRDAGTVSNALAELVPSTTYFYRYYATNSAGDNWAGSSGSFTTEGIPAVDNDGGVADVTQTGATLRGTLTSAGTAPASVSVYWGTSDGGTNANSWGHTNAFGVRAVGALATNVTGLLPGQDYWYRFHAANAWGGVWAGSPASFHTPGTPSIDNATGASGVTVAAATLNGAISSIGEAEPAVRVYWGAIDGGTNAGSWAYTNAFAGTFPVGPVSTNVTLAAPGHYYYRYFAENAEGGVWAPATAHFMAAEVTLVASDPTATEMGPESGEFTVSRPASATGDVLTVAIGIGGSASNGTDYAAIAGSVTFGADEYTRTVTILPVKDLFSEGDETVVLTLLAGPYAIGASASDTVTIADTFSPADVAWDGGDPTDSWNAPANWDPDSVPGFGSRVTLAAGLPATITLDGPQGASNITYNSAANTTVAAGSGGSLTVVEGVTKLGAGTLTFTVNPSVGGDLIVSNGAVHPNIGAYQTFGGSAASDIVLAGGQLTWQTLSTASDTTATPGLSNNVVVMPQGGTFYMGNSANGAGHVLNTLDLRGALTVSSPGGGNAIGGGFAGVVTLWQQAAATLRYRNNTGHNGTDYIWGSIVDGAGGAGNPFRVSSSGNPLSIAGAGSTYAGGTVVEAGGEVVTVKSGSSLGVGDVTIQDDGRVLLAGGGANLGPAAQVTVEKGGAFGVGGSASLASSVTAASAGIYAVEGAAHAYALDLSAMGNGAMFLGTINGGTYSGALSPGAGDVYRLGGGRHGAGTVVYPLVIGGVDSLSGTARLQVGSSSNELGQSGRTFAQLSAAQSYSGGTDVRSGWLTAGTSNAAAFGSGKVLVHAGAFGASGAAGSLWNGSSQFTHYALRPGADILLHEGYGNRSAALGGRWGDAAPMTLRDNGLLAYGGKNNTYAEAFGTLAFEGRVLVSLSGGGGTSRWFGDMAALEQRGWAVLETSVTPGPDLRLRPATPPALVNGMAPACLLDAGGANFLTYDGGSDSLGVVGLKAVAYTSTDVSTAVASDIVNEAADRSLGASTAVHALRKTGGNLALGGNTLTLGSGGLIASGNNTRNFTGGTLDFGATGVVYAAGATVFGCTVAGGDIVKAGAGTLELEGDNVFTGTLAVLEGVVRVDAGSGIGATNGLHVGYYGTFSLGSVNQAIGDLSGHGTVALNGRALTVGGDVAPGSEAGTPQGTLTVSGAGSLAFGAGARLVMGIADPDGFEDRVVVTAGNVDVSGLQARITDLGGLPLGVHTLIDTRGGTMTGTPGVARLTNRGSAARLFIENNDLKVSFYPGPSVLIVR